MLRYLARRLAASALILLGVSIVTFGLTFLIPADRVAILPVIAMIGLDRGSTRWRRAPRRN